MDFSQGGFLGFLPVLIGIIIAGLIGTLVFLFKNK